MIYIVSYTLNPKRDATRIIAELKRSDGWAHDIDNTWLIATKENAAQLYERIRHVFLASDYILITQFTPSAGYSGWMRKVIWDWIQQNRYY